MNIFPIRLQLDRLVFHAGLIIFTKKLTIFFKTLLISITFPICSIHQTDTVQNLHKKNMNNTNHGILHSTITPTTSSSGVWE